MSRNAVLGQIVPVFEPLLSWEAPDVRSLATVLSSTDFDYGIDCDHLYLLLGRCRGPGTSCAPGATAPASPAPLRGAQARRSVRPCAVKCTKLSVLAIAGCA